jgi:hypothetical protein
MKRSSNFIQPFHSVAQPMRPVCLVSLQPASFATARNAQNIVGGLGGILLVCSAMAHRQCHSSRLRQEEKGRTFYSKNSISIRRAAFECHGERPSVADHRTELGAKFCRIVIERLPSHSMAFATRLVRLIRYTRLPEAKRNYRTERNGSVCIFRQA